MKVAWDDDLGARGRDQVQESNGETTQPSDHPALDSPPPASAHSNHSLIPIPTPSLPSPPSPPLPTPTTIRKRQQRRRLPPPQPRCPVPTPQPPPHPALHLLQHVKRSAVPFISPPENSTPSWYQQLCSLLSPSAKPALQRTQVCSSLSKRYTSFSGAAGDGGAAAATRWRSVCSVAGEAPGKSRRMRSCQSGAASQAAFQDLHTLQEGRGRMWAWGVA